MTATPKRRLRLPRGRYVLLIFALALVALAVDFFAYPYGASLPPGPSGNRGENGLWLRYTWYFGEKSDADRAALTEHLRERQVRYAYFHVRFIERSGKLHFRYPEQARQLTDTLKRDAPDIRRVAWIYAGNKRGEGNVDLDSPDVRAKMVAEAVWLVGECGFDGIQWDYEICEEGNQGLLALLKESRGALPPGTLLGIATPLYAPAPFSTLGYGWNDGYFQQIAALCDQIAVMGYDSGLYLPRAYVALMRSQVVHVTRAARAANPECRVLIGVPTYWDGGPSHYPYVENLEVALRGVREGYTALSPEDRESFAGIAPFADYTTDDREWEMYRKQWLETSR
jgi:hypothetical protein